MQPGERWSASKNAVWRSSSIFPRVASLLRTGNWMPTSVPWPVTRSPLLVALSPSTAHWMKKPLKVSASCLWNASSPRDSAPAHCKCWQRRRTCACWKCPISTIEPLVEYRSITRGVLQQSVDLGDPEGTQWRVVTEKEPTAQQLADLKFAWKACQHVKSNAIVFAKDEATIGIGGGQPNRVDCVVMAAQRASEKAQGAVMASDAFFPFSELGRKSC